ncbi:MAG: hypothetical protein ACE5KH_02320 [Candidatus Geothermarchaeales archaeon]
MSEESVARAVRLAEENYCTVSVFMRESGARTEAVHKIVKG